MRFFEFKQFLAEAGLSNVDLKKHRGQYLDVLINSIASGKLIELEGEARSKYGETVKIEPSDAKMLSQLFYGTDTPPEDKSTVNATDNGNLIPANNLPRSIALTINGTNDKILTSSIFKTPEMKASKKDFNTGDVGEAFLGAACAAKFKKLGKKINENDVLGILKTMEVSELGKKQRNKKGTVKTSAGKDSLDFVLVLNKTSFSSLERALSSGKMPPEMIGLNRSAVEWANTSKAVEEAVKIVIKDPDENNIIVKSDGVEDQKGTKADLFLTIDDSTIELLSAKAGDVKQFGQVPGNSYEKAQTLFKSIFGIDIKESYIDQMNGSVAKDNYPIFKKIYRDVAQELEQELSGNTTKEVKFVERLYNGISYHASLNDPKVSMVILKASPNSPGFKELSFGQALKEAMEQFDLKVTFQADPPKIQIHGIPIGQDAKQETKLAGNTLLVQVRTNLKGDSSEGYIRSLIEMGGLLKAIAAVEQDIKQDELESDAQGQSLTPRPNSELNKS